MRQGYGWFILLCGLVCYGTGIPPSAAQQQEDRPETELRKSTERKYPSFFHRPAMSSPTQQLAYAQSLAAQGHTRQAVKQYLALVHAWHQSPEAPKAQMVYAQALKDRRKYLEAFDEFQYLIDHFAGQFPYDEALKSQIEIANYLMTVRRGKWLFFSGFSAPERALPLFETIVRNAPQWERTPNAQFAIGLIHEELRDYELAAAAFASILDRYPNNALATDAAYRESRCLFTLAERSPRDERVCREALSALAAFLRDYPDHPQADAARKDLNSLKERLAREFYDKAVYYDTIMRKPESALIAYRDLVRHCPSSPLAEKAAERIQVLEAQKEKKVP